jgi:hypothetical protein
MLHVLITLWQKQLRTAVNGNGERMKKHADELQYAQLPHKGSGPDKDNSTPIYFHKLFRL